jgi:hypothetical protein
MTARLTLRDLRELCERYVPIASRHPDSLEHPDRVTQLWRYSHELGHLLTVPPTRIGSRGFGMDPELEGDPREVVWIPYDLAAMHVSKRLLGACGRADLFYGRNGELDDANLEVVRDHHYEVADRILRRRRVLRLPADRLRLEAKVRRVVEQAGRASMLASSRSAPDASRSPARRPAQGVQSQHETGPRGHAALALTNPLAVACAAPSMDRTTPSRG